MNKPASFISTGTVEPSTKVRAKRNRTMTATRSEQAAFHKTLLTPSFMTNTNYLNRTIHGDCLEALAAIPAASFDLIVLDPPYNLNKKFGARSFARVSVDAYT